MNQPSVNIKKIVKEELKKLSAKSLPIFNNDEIIDITINELLMMKKPEIYLTSLLSRKVTEDQLKMNLDFLEDFLVRAYKDEQRENKIFSIKNYNLINDNVLTKHGIKIKKSLTNNNVAEIKSLEAKMATNFVLNNEELLFNLPPLKLIKKDCHLQEQLTNQTLNYITECDLATITSSREKPKHFVKLAKRFTSNKWQNNQKESN